MSDGESRTVLVSGRAEPAKPQHFLYFLPLPHGQGSFLP
jgi:hypothetical protein